MTARAESGAQVFVPPPPPPPGKPIPAAVLVSGQGTTLQNFLDEIAAGRLPMEVRIVVSSRGKAFALERARRAGIATAVLRPREFPDARRFGEAIAAVTAEAGAELLCMAGWLAFWEIPPRLMGRVLNVHPSLLPAFGGPGMHGERVHEAVLEHGCKVSGCTVHVADNIYDHGPIVLQRVVPVLDDDTVESLRARVFHEECIAYPQAIRLIVEGRLRIDGRRVRIIPPPSRGAG